MCFIGDMTITCALRWGVAFVGIYSTMHCSPRRGTPFQVQGVFRETNLTRDRHCEESQVVALVLKDDSLVRYLPFTKTSEWRIPHVI